MVFNLEISCLSLTFELYSQYAQCVYSQHKPICEPSILFPLHLFYCFVVSYTCSGCPTVQHLCSMGNTVGEHSPLSIVCTVTEAVPWCRKSSLHFSHQMSRGRTVIHGESEGTTQRWWGHSSFFLPLEYAIKLHFRLISQSKKRKRTWVLTL